MLTRQRQELDDAPHKPQSTVSILIVDDDSTKRFALKTILRFASCSGRNSP